jgi:hypothetical protein
VRDYAEAMICAVLGHHQRVADAARLRLAGANCAGGPMLVQVNPRVCAAPARVQITGRTPAQAIAEGAARLACQIRRLSRTGQAWPWPAPQRRPLGVPGPGRITRVKTVPLRTGKPWQASAVMTAMDYDAHLFTDADTGKDAIIYGAGPTGLALARQRRMHPPSQPPTGPTPIAAPIVVNPRRVPALTAAEAADRLAAGWLPFLFYTDRDSRRGNLLYRRYDGDLGLIIPTVPAAQTAGPR